MKTLERSIFRLAPAVAATKRGSSVWDWRMQWRVVGSTMYHEYPRELVARESEGSTQGGCWASSFPSKGRPRSFIQGFPLEDLHLSGKAAALFVFRLPTT